MDEMDGPIFMNSNPGAIEVWLYIAFGFAAPFALTGGWHFLNPENGLNGVEIVVDIIFFGAAGLLLWNRPGVGTILGMGIAAIVGASIILKSYVGAYWDAFQWHVPVEMTLQLRELRPLDPAAGVVSAFFIIALIGLGIVFKRETASAYRRLTIYLQAQPAKCERVTLSLREVARIIGRPLPVEARWLIPSTPNIW